MSTDMSARARSLTVCHVAGTACLLLALLAPRAAGQEGKGVDIARPPAPRVHFVLCGLTSDRSIGTGAAANLTRLGLVLKREVGADYIGSFEVLDGEKCSEAGILGTIRGVRLEKNDTFFCYYAGHGAYDPSRALGDPSGGHFFSIPSGDLMRKTLFDEMKNKNARLTVLISDSCNVPALAMPKIKWGEVTAAAPEGTEMERLLLMYSGDVDINSSSQGQASWYYDGGGWFTSILCADLPNFDDWQRMFDRLGKDAKFAFGYQYLIQEPQAFRLNVKPLGQLAVTNRAWKMRNINRQTTYLTVPK